MGSRGLATQGWLVASQLGIPTRVKALVSMERKSAVKGNGAFVRGISNLTKKYVMGKITIAMV
jgi:hypothetical protein